MTMGLPCDREGYDLRMPQCPKCGSRGCPSLHRYRGECSADKSTSEPVAPVKAVGSEALREARIAELEAALEDLTHSAERRIESGFWPMDFHYVTRRARAVLTTKAPQAWLEAKAEIDANWPDPTPDRKAQT